MQKIFKIFFIFLTFLFTLTPVAFGVESFAVQKSADFSVEQVEFLDISQNVKSSEAYVVSANFLPLEISSGCERDEVFINGTLDKSSSQNKLLQQILNAKYNQQFIATSHNISSYLKNEICTRAP